MSDAELEFELEPDGFVDKPQEGSPFDDFVVLLSQRVVQQIKKHTEPHLDHEMGGLLIGDIWESHGVTYVCAKESIPSQVHGSHATLSFTVDTWIELEQQHAELFPQYKKIGWYHSHLGFGIFLSPLDTFLHEYAFSLPWHVALVYDPVLSMYGIFRWQEGKLIPARFYVTSEQDTFEEVPMSHAISHQLEVLSGYLDGLSIATKLNATVRNLQSRLQKLPENSTPGLSPIEDILNTVVEIAEIDPKALKQTRGMLRGMIGQPIIRGQNAHLASSVPFENEKLTISQTSIYFIERERLYWFPLSQQSRTSVITVPTSLCDIAENKDSVFALNETGIIYVIPKSSLSLIGRERKKNSSSSTYLDFKTIVLSPQSVEPLRTITARGNTLYLSSNNDVWIVKLEDNLDHLRPFVFNLASLKGESPARVAALTVDGQENIYLADTANNRVLMMQPDGRIKYSFLGDGRRPLVTPISLCVSRNEMYVLDISIRSIIVYNLVSKTYSRHYTWGEFVGNKAIQRLYTDETARVYFSAGYTFLRLYQLDDRPVS
jgi:proteasome lid subunit RPN8/RPN11